MTRFIKILSVLFLVVQMAGVWAAEVDTEESLKHGTTKGCNDDCVEVGVWSFGVGLGLGFRSNPLVDGDDIPLLVLPEVSYYGEKFFLKNLELGFTLWETSSNQLNVLLTPSFDQMHFNRWDINNFTDSAGLASNVSPSVGGNTPPKTISGSGDDTKVGGDTDISGSGTAPPTDNGLVPDTSAPETELPLEGSGAKNPLEAGPNPTEQASYVLNLKRRKLAALAGVEYMYSFPRLSLHFQGLWDVSQVHNGHELRAAAIIPFDFEKNKWALTLGLNYQSSKVLDYYYGVNAAEVTNSAVQYSIGSSGLSSLIRLDWQRWVSPHWSWRGMVQISSLAGAIQDSPIISETAVTSVFFGGVYHF